MRHYRKRIEHKETRSSLFVETVSLPILNRLAQNKSISRRLCYVTQKIEFIFERFKNIAGKGENVGYIESTCSIFLTMFSKGIFFFFGVFKGRECILKG